jgi:hypothetical protein
MSLRYLRFITLASVLSVTLNAAADEGLITIVNNQIDRDSITDTLCYKTAAALLHDNFAGSSSAFLDFNQVYSTKILGTTFGLAGFARVETWGQDAAPHHVNYYAVSATCELSGKDFVLSDKNGNGVADIGDLNLNYIDFDRY